MNLYASCRNVSSSEGLCCQCCGLTFAGLRNLRHHVTENPNCLLFWGGDIENLIKDAKKQLNRIKQQKHYRKDPEKERKRKQEEYKNDPEKQRSRKREEYENDPEKQRKRKQGEYDNHSEKQKNRK